MDQWDDGTDYDLFMGRWSRSVADRFVDKINVAEGARWLDVGCGTGALLAMVVDKTLPSRATGVEPSTHFASVAQARLGERADIHVADGEALPFDDASFDVVVSALALNFIEDPLTAVREWGRVSVDGGQIHAYVWDYAEGMAFLRHFWDAAVLLEPAAAELDEAVRFPMCQPDCLNDVFRAGGLSQVEVGSIEVDTKFTDFADFWDPFCRGQGPAPTYVSGLDPERRSTLEEYLRSELPWEANGSLCLTARAWTASGST